MRATFDLFVLLAGAALVMVVLPVLGGYLYGPLGWAGGILVALLVIAIDFQRWMDRHYG